MIDNSKPMCFLKISFQLCMAHSTRNLDPSKPDTGSLLGRSQELAAVKKLRRKGRAGFTALEGLDSGEFHKPTTPFIPFNAKHRSLRKMHQAPSE